jgi:hypothetical protein
MRLLWCSSGAVISDWKRFTASVALLSSSANRAAKYSFSFLLVGLSIPTLLSASRAKSFLPVLICISAASNAAVFEVVELFFFERAFRVTNAWSRLFSAMRIRARAI